MRRHRRDRTRAFASASLRSALAVLITAGFLLSPPAQQIEPAYATTEVRLLDTALRTETDLRATWQSFKPVYGGTPYSVTPSTSYPYSTGAVRTEFLNDGLRTINFARYLAGLPSDVVLDSTRNLDAQHGAVLLAASNFSHYPNKPADMSQSFYDRGLASTSSSNIGNGYTDIERFQMGCLDDSGAGNISRVGHRRWLLNPQMKRTGIGYADSRVTTYVFDRSRAETVQYTSVLWPSSGTFPVEFFSSATPWSITLNPDRFDIASSGQTLTLRRVSDGRTWTFNSTHKNTSGHYFNVDFSGMGVRNAIIFRPDPSTVSYRPGDEFEVTISGGVFLKGTTTPVKLSYWTQFVTLDPNAAPTAPGVNYGEVLNASERLSARCRFSTAITIARAAYPNWTGVKDVVIASGDDRAAADPLAASGLCWAYDAPMLLVSAARTPDEVKAAVKEIVAKNGSVTLRVVGGTSSVPNARIAEIQNAAGGSTKVKVDRILSTGGRYDLAAAIAGRMKSVRGAEMPSVALIANGADPAKFFDALALSPIAAAKGAPILLVEANKVPPATASALANLKPALRVVGGGPLTVSERVRNQVGAVRWSGASRYDTAIAVANNAVTRGWLSRYNVGVAAKMPDALTGGSLMGKRGGVLLLSQGTSLTASTKSWLTSYKSQVGDSCVFGGPLSISDTVRIDIGQALQ